MQLLVNNAKFQVGSQRRKTAAFGARKHIISLFFFHYLIFFVQVSMARCLSAGSVFRLCFTFFSGCELLKENGVSDGVLAEFTKLAEELFLKLHNLKVPNGWMDKAIRDQLRKCGAPRMGLNAE